MRLVKSVTTQRGGDTCHAAIFCREQGIPAVTGVGKATLNGQLLKTGDALTVDANNGNIYAMDADPKKRLPIIFSEFDVKGYGIPGDPDNMPYPKIGQIIAASSAAQQNSPIMVAVDADGNSLTRAEFKGEEIGVNVFAGYGHYLIQQIKAGKMVKPSRIYASDLVNAKIKGSEAFESSMSRDIFDYLKNHSSAWHAFAQAFGRDPGMPDSVRLLTAFDIMTEKALGVLTAEDLENLTKEQKAVVSFMESLSTEDREFFNYAYGVFQRRFNYNYNIITDLENHPWILTEIEKKLQEKGYTNFDRSISARNSLISTT